MVNGFDIKMVVKSNAIGIVFKSGGPFRIYKLISTDNSAQFRPKRAGLAVLIDHYLFMRNILSNTGVGKGGELFETPSRWAGGQQS